MTGFDLANLPVLSWLVVGAILVAAVIAAGIGYRSLGRGKGSAEPAAPIDQARRMLVSAGHAEAPIPNVVEWKTARDAVEAYADPELLQSRAVWIERFETVTRNEAGIQHRIKEIKDRYPDGEMPEDARQELDKAERQLRMKAMVLVNAEEEVRQLRLDIHSDVYKKLCLGKLVAKGFREPFVPGSPEKYIPPAAWRALMLQHLDGRAVEKGIDGRVVYSGIVIGKLKG